ncbi:hypothetical protein B0H13DRAFT_2570869 [Mycena leptocephala]|nr:hypothetical protein B0H13DRAFT_2570869 [Mycena leptocephala]
MPCRGLTKITFSKRLINDRAHSSPTHCSPMLKFSKFLVAIICAVSVVDAAPEFQTVFTAGSANIEAMTPRPLGHFTIGNIDSQGSLLFEGPDGRALIDFRRTGGYGKTEIWEIRDTGNGQSTIWNIGLFSSDELWTYGYSGKPRYPRNMHLALTKPPAGDLPDAFLNGHDDAFHIQYSKIRLTVNAISRPITPPNQEHHLSPLLRPTTTEWYGRRARRNATSLAPPAPARQRVLCPTRSPLPPAVWQSALSATMCSSIWLYLEPELEGKNRIDVNAVRSGQVGEPLTPRSFLTLKFGTLPSSPA